MFSLGPCRDIGLMLQKHTIRASGRKQQQINARHTHTQFDAIAFCRSKKKSKEKQSNAMDGQGKDLSMVARTKRTDGRTRFFGSLTQLSL